MTDTMIQRPSTAESSLDDLRFFLTADIMGIGGQSSMEVVSTEEETIKQVETVCRAQGHNVCGHEVKYKAKDTIAYFREGDPREYFVLTNNMGILDELKHSPTEVHRYNPNGKSAPYERLHSLIKTRMSLI